MKLLGKIYKNIVKAMVFTVSLVLFPLILPLWIICEVISRAAEMQLKKAEKGEKENGQKKRN